MTEDISWEMQQKGYKMRVLAVPLNIEDIKTLDVKPEDKIRTLEKGTKPGDPVYDIMGNLVGIVPDINKDFNEEPTPMVTRGKMGNLRG